MCTESIDSMEPIRLTCRFSQFLLFCLFTLFLWGCEEEPVVEVAPVVEEDPAIMRAERWADEQLKSMSLPEKIGQLVMVRAPEWSGKPEGKAMPAESLAAWVKEMSAFHIGGVLLSDGHRKSLARISYELGSASNHPLWVGLEAGKAWSDFREMPSLIALGATNSDHLAYQWGMNLGRECQWLGGNIVFVSAGRVLADTALHTDGLASRPERVSWLGEALVKGASDAGVIPAVRFLASYQERDLDVEDLFPQNTRVPDSIQSFELAPLKNMLDMEVGAICLEHQVFTGLDSFPLSLSSSLQQEMLRHELQYDGLVFSPPFTDSAFTTLFSPGEAEVMAITAGTDMIVAPSQLEAVLKSLGEAVEGGLLPERDLDKIVYRHLYQKALMGLDTLEMTHPDSVFNQGPLVRMATLNREVTRDAVTLIRDEPGRLPLKKVATTRIATLSIGPNKRSAFQRSLNQYAKMDHFFLPGKPSPTQLKSLSKKLKPYNYTLVSLHPDVYQADSAVAIDSALQAFLYQLPSQTRLVVANFAAPALVKDLDSVGVLVQHYDNRSIAQRQVAEFIFGGQGSQGSQPYHLDSLLAFGSGIVHADPSRLSFCSPQELGIIPDHSKRIDSLVYAAIRNETFPGCQVLAVHQGNVFFQKAYGYHSYDREVKVGLNDVYDIASVTKIAATTLMTMWSYDRDSINLKTPIKAYLPELDSAFITLGDITPTELLIHKAGLPSGLPIYKYCTMVDSVDSVRTQIYSAAKDSSHGVQIADELFINAAYLDTIWDRTRRVPLKTRGSYVYSDMSMFLLKKVLESRHETPLNRFVSRNFYGPMGLKTIGYHPLKRFKDNRVVPTETDRWWRKQTLQGYVHDESTALFGGVGGQAGLFSNAKDLAVLMQMLLNEGKYGGTRYINSSTIRKFTSRHPDSHRGLGFDMQKPIPTPDKGMVCYSAPPTTFGHTGFTGTCAWADPENEVIFIFLSNRVYPTRKNRKINIYRVRQNIQQVIYDALHLEMPPEGICDPEADAEWMLAQQALEMENADSLPSGDSLAEPVVKGLVPEPELVTQQDSVKCVDC